MKRNELSMSLLFLVLAKSVLSHQGSNTVSKVCKSVVLQRIYNYILGYTTVYTLLTIVLVAGTCDARAECCSEHFYCGTGPKYCGSGCRFGPCNVPHASATPFRVIDVVTDAFFNRIANQAAPGCPGRGFYTRVAFLQAYTLHYPGFCASGSADDSRRGIVAFFAHVTHETGHMCSRAEIGGSSRSYCNNSDIQYPCATGVGYYGRGPLQLSGNHNYGAAGQSIGFDGLRNPDIVATNNVISFRTALWFWMRTCHDPMVSGQGFGATIRAINGPQECNGMRSEAMRSILRALATVKRSSSDNSSNPRIAPLYHICRNVLECSTIQTTVVKLESTLEAISVVKSRVKNNNMINK